MADLIHGNPELGATKQDLIAALVQKELAAKANLLPYVTDVSRFAVKGAKSISFPKFGSFTPINRATATAGDAAVLTATTDKLDLDINAYIAWIVDSSDEIQSTVAVQSELALRAASGHGRYVDFNIIAELEAAGTATTTTGAISRNVILEMRETLLKANADMNELVLVLDPTSETDLLKIEEFTKADVYGQAVIPSGMIGRVYGVPVLINNQLDDDQYFMFAKSGIAIGFQKSPAISEQGANEFGSGAVRVAMDQLYGVKAMQGAALIVKDGN
jgi:hypothetical protein